MTPQDLENFMTRHQMSSPALAELLGVTRMAVDHWLKGSRTISLTVARTLKMFDKYPGLVKEFAS